MIDHNAELFRQLAESYGIKVTPYETEFGNTYFEAQDHIDVRTTHRKLLDERIGNLEKLIRYLQKISKPYYELSLRKLRINVEIDKLKRELVDCMVEYIAKDSYIINWQKRVSEAMIIEQDQLKKADEELPTLIKLAYRYVEENSRPFTKSAALVAGYIATHEQGYKNNRIKIHTYQGIKRELDAATSIAK